MGCAQLAPGLREAGFLWDYLYHGEKPSIAKVKSRVLTTRRKYACSFMTSNELFLCMWLMWCDIDVAYLLNQTYCCHLRAVERQKKCNRGWLSAFVNVKAKHLINESAVQGFNCIEILRERVFLLNLCRRRRVTIKMRLAHDTGALHIFERATFRQKLDSGHFSASHRMPEILVALSYFCVWALYLQVSTLFLMSKNKVYTSLTR